MDTAAGLLSNFQSKHASLAKLVHEEEEMLLTLSFYLERVRFDTLRQSSRSSPEKAEGTTSPTEQREVQFSKRLSECQEIGSRPPAGEGIEWSERPTRSRPIPAPLYLSNVPPSPIKSRSRSRAGSSKGSRPAKFPSEGVNNMYSINGIGDFPTDMRNSFVDIVKSFHSTIQNQTLCGRWLAPCFLCMSHVLDKLYSFREPERTSCLARLVKSQFFSMLSTIVILANAAFIFFATDYEMQHLNEPTPQAIRIGDLVLASFYVIEVFLKLLVHRAYFFWNVDFGWNWFDFFLVIVSVVENLLAYDLSPSEAASDPVNLGFLRLLRLCKIVKILRIFRTLRFFSDLRLMLDCVLGSLMNVMWCIIMLVFVMYVFALFVQQSLVGFLQEEAAKPSDKDTTLIFHYFGSVEYTLLTLFQSITSGVDWKDPYDVLEVSGLLQVTYVAYVAFVFISVWNIVTSTFVEKALKLAQPDIDLLVVEQQLRDFEDTQMLAQLFGDMLQTDEEGEHKVGLKEFQTLLETYQFRSYLQTRGIDIKNAETFFKMLVELQGEPTIDAITFANACVRMKGAATSIDLQTVMFTTHLMNKEQRRAFQFMYSRLQKIESLLNGGGEWSESVTSPKAVSRNFSGKSILSPTRQEFEGQNGRSLSPSTF